MFYFRNYKLKTSFQFGNRESNYMAQDSWCESNRLAEAVALGFRNVYFLNFHLYLFICLLNSTVLGIILIIIYYISIFMYNWPVQKSKLEQLMILIFSLLIPKEITSKLWMIFSYSLLFNLLIYILLLISINIYFY